ncbi:MAG TPA: hypothetical protein PKD49_06370 [Hyphomicrobium sp.]|nr:hypothetical protein [Hyphomicrobium sp.]
MSPRFLSSYNSDDGLALAASAHDGLADFFAGERICPPSHRARAGSSWLRAWIVILTMGGASWGWLQVPETIKEPLHEAIAFAVTTLASRAVSGRAEDAAPAEPQASQPLPRPSAAREIAEAPGAQSGTQVLQEPAPASTAPGALGADAAAAVSGEEVAGDEPAGKAGPERLPPPAVDPADRYAARALAAGLHPDLSRVVLGKLTLADYGNARQAITAALAETPDGGTYIWPPKPDRKHAQFEVRFVAGAPKDCRRYVVTVIKDRWSTTARAMEKCAASVRG